MQKEEWRPVAGYIGWYEVSNLGRLKRVRGGGRNAIAGRILKAAIGGRGYLQVQLCKHGRARTLRVHVLLARAFLGKAPEGHECHHLDRNPRNNRANNLVYLPYMDHVATRRPARGIHQGHSKLTNAEVRAIRRLRASGIILSRLGSMFGVHTSTIGRICLRETWAHVA